MRNTKENVIALINEMIRHARKMETIYQNCYDTKSTIETKGEIRGLEHALFLMTDKEYFNHLWEAFKTDFEG